MYCETTWVEYSFHFQKETLNHTSKFQDSFLLLTGSQEKFGFHPQLNILWLFDKFQLICYQARTQKCLLKLDLRCKLKVVAHQTERSLKFSMINSITNSVFVHQFDADEGPIRYSEKEFDFLPEAEHTVLHDSAILHQSEDKCSIRIHDYLRPFLS